MHSSLNSSKKIIDFSWKEFYVYLVKRFRVSYSKRIQYYLFRQSTLKPLSFVNTLWIRYRFYELTINLFFCIRDETIIYSWVNYGFTIFSKMDSVNMTISSLNPLWIDHLFREVTINPQSIGALRIYFEFIILFANILWINFLYHEFTSCITNSLWIHHLFRDFTIYFANIPWIHYLFCELTMDPSFLRINSLSLIW